MRVLFQTKGRTRTCFGSLGVGTAQGAESAALGLDSALRKRLLELVGAAQTSLLGQSCQYPCSASWSLSWIHFVFYFGNNSRGFVTFQHMLA